MINNYQDDIMTSPVMDDTYIWNNLDTLSPSTVSDNNSNHDLLYSPNLSVQGSIISNASNNSNTTEPGITTTDSAVFNISWGGDDTPPTELHPIKQETHALPKRPLPKPRGIRKLPEPDPAEDGTVDEDTLRRRKNTDAARRSRMKKFMKVDELENKVTILQAENAKLILSKAVLESEKKGLYAKEREYQKRIKYLEDIMRMNGWDFSKLEDKSGSNVI
ncbi:hypothetical protein BDB01DRAFT_894975 [Pilobolus umbonatus]|nr:hypothetical protein BDB01DRAFT_894975 [Pilobolus umbonatus]